MGESGPLPDRAPPVRAEMLHESERMRVTRLFLSGGTVIRKEPLGPDGQRRLQHELAFLERLRGVKGVAQVLDEPRYPGSITLADGGEASLAQLVKPLAVDDLIGLAEQLAQAVAAMHGRGVMHRDICPANIVTSSTADAVSGGFRVGDVAGRDASAVHPPHPNRRHAGVFGARADRAYRSAGGSPRRFIRVGRDAV